MSAIYKDRYAVNIALKLYLPYILIDIYVNIPPNICLRYIKIDMP